MGHGDGTVPTLSAARVGNISDDSGVDLNAPNAELYYHISPEPDFDYLMEHTALTKDDSQDGTHNLLLYLLGLGPRPYIINEYPTLSETRAKNQMRQDSTAFWSNSNISSQISRLPSYYLTILGVPKADVSDDSGNSIMWLEGGGFINRVQGLTYKVVGDDALTIVMSTTRGYTVEFQTGNSPVKINLVKGIGNLNPQSAIRYLDLDLPAGVRARLILDSKGVQDLRYDADGDGTFETTVNPTVAINGSGASDIAPPTLNINVVRQGNTATVRIFAEDFDSGVRTIKYSLDGINFSTYTAPLTVNYTASPVTVYVFADDNAANRSGLLTKTFSFGASVIPVAECIEANGGEFRAWFGYENEINAAVTISIGANNIFYPLPGNRGQVTSFQPGRVNRAFSVLMRGKRLDWKLHGADGISRTATASLANTPRCQ